MLIHKNTSDKKNCQVYCFCLPIKHDYSEIVFYRGVSHYGQLIMDVISMVTFPFFNAHVSENVWPATWIQPPPHPPIINQHWKPTINHDSRAVISYKLSFERFKMLLQRTLYFKNRTFFNFLLQLPVISVNMGKIVVWLVLVRRTSTRGVTTMGRVCVAMDGLGRIAPKVGTRIVWRQHF